MLTTLLRLGLARQPAGYERAFVDGVQVRDSLVRKPWVDRLILAGWLLIVVKCFVVIWVIDHWSVPFHPYWIIVPTILMAAFGTAAYYWRD
jgi:hypothetical protein